MDGQHLLHEGRKPETGEVVAMRYDSATAGRAGTGGDSSEGVLNAMLDQVCRIARDSIGSEYAVLGVKTHSNSAAAYFATSGVDPDIANGLQRPALDQGILGQVLSE